MFLSGIQRFGTFKTSGFPTEAFGNDRHFVLSFSFSFDSPPPLRLLNLAALVAQTSWSGFFGYFSCCKKK